MSSAEASATPHSHQASALTVFLTEGKRGTASHAKVPRPSQNFDAPVSDAVAELPSTHTCTATHAQRASSHAHASPPTHQHTSSLSPARRARVCGRDNSAHTPERQTGHRALQQLQQPHPHLPCSMLTAGRVLLPGCSGSAAAAGSSGGRRLHSSNSKILGGSPSCGAPRSLVSRQNFPRMA